MVKPEVKRLLGRFKHSWEDNIKMDIRGIGWVGMEWINLAQGEHGNEPASSIECWQVLEYMSDW
jgi:hypothetical protein